MLKLKKYQDDALAALGDFLGRCAGTDVSIDAAYKAALAAQSRHDEPYHQFFEGVPVACLRVPTGGGKTLLAAHSVAIAGRLLATTDSPIALWLTPSDTIRTQTIEALTNVRHPYRQALANDFGDRVRVCDLESLQTIGAHDVGTACIIVVATIQALNVSDTAQRNVYSFFEELGEHFRELPAQVTDKLEKVTEADLQRQTFLTQKDIGRVKWSVANWINLTKPIVIIDEAHNNRTDRFFKTLGRLNPSCVVRAP